MAPAKKAAPPDPRQQSLLTLFSKQPKSIPQASSGPPPPPNPNSSTSTPAGSLSTSAKSIKESVKSAGTAIASAVQKGKQEVVAVAKKVTDKVKQDVAPPAPKPISTEGWKSKPSIVKALDACKSEADLVDYYVKIHSSDPNAPKYTIPDEDMVLKPLKDCGGVSFESKLRQPDDLSPSRVPSDPSDRLALFTTIFESTAQDVSDRSNHPEFDQGHQRGLHPLFGHLPSRQVLVKSCYSMIDSLGSTAAHATRGVLLSLHFGEMPAKVDVENLIAVPKQGKNGGAYGAMGTSFIEIGHALASYCGISTTAGQGQQGGLAYRIWQGHFGGKRLKEDKYFYRIAFDPTLKDKHDPKFNGDWIAFVIGAATRSLNLPSPFIVLLTIAFEGIVIKMSFSPSFELGNGSEGEMPAKVKNWEAENDRLDDYKQDKRDEAVHPLNRAFGCEASAYGHGSASPNYSEQDRLRAAQKNLQTCEEIGYDKAHGLKEFEAGLTMEDKSVLTTERMAKAAEKDPNTKLGGVVHDLLDGTRIIRATDKKGKKVHLRIYNPANIVLVDSLGSKIKKGVAYRIHVGFDDENDPHNTWVTKLTPLKPRDGLNSATADNREGRNLTKERDMAEREAERKKTGKEAGTRKEDGSYISSRKFANADYIDDDDEDAITIRADDKKTHKAFDSTEPLVDLVKLIQDRLEDEKSFDNSYSRKRANKQRDKAKKRAAKQATSAARAAGGEDESESEKESTSPEDEDDSSVSAASSAALSMNKPVKIKDYSSALASSSPSALGSIQSGTSPAFVASSSGASTSKLVQVNKDSLKVEPTSRKTLASIQAEPVSYNVSPSTSGTTSNPPSTDWSTSTNPYAVWARERQAARDKQVSAPSTTSAEASSSRKIVEIDSDDDVSMRSSRPLSHASGIYAEQPSQDEEDNVELEEDARSTDFEDDRMSISSRDSRMSGLSFASRRSTSSKMSGVEMLDNIASGKKNGKKGMGWTSGGFYDD